MYPFDFSSDEEIMLILLMAI